ncbi:TPM domain-containing protein [Tenacibaculum sp.]
MILFTILFVVELGYSQFVIAEKPEFIPPVIDSIQLLGKNQYEKLYNKLRTYSDSTSTEIAVAIVSSTKGESIGILAPRWAHKWGIGQEKEDNGVFILLAKDDRKIWIAPGYGVEHKLTAGIVGELTRNIIIPEFKRGDYYSGLDKGTDAIFQILKGEYKGTRKETKKTNFGFIIFIIILIVFFIIISSGNRGNRGGGRRYRKTDAVRDIIDTIILSNAGRGGFGGGSFGGGSSGGFGGFGGGGGFSGGGAGGSW